jgi:hypothetical protein
MHIWWAVGTGRVKTVWFLLPGIWIVLRKGKMILG